MTEIRATPRRPVTQPDLALTTALAARARRNGARQLASTDPLFARDLRIGRPDLPVTYEDGGLVDIPISYWDVLRDRGSVIPLMS